MSRYTSGALTALRLPARGRLVVGHVDESSRDDPAVPVPAREYPADAGAVDATCRSCPARSELSRRGAEALMLIIHRDGCPELAAIRGLVA